MTTLSNPGGDGIDMTTWVAPNTNAAPAQVNTAHDATSVHLFGDQWQFKVVDTGFKCQTEGIPPNQTYDWVAGTIHGFTSYANLGGEPLYTISGLNLSLSAFNALLTSTTTAAFEASLFGCSYVILLDGSSSAAGLTLDNLLTL